MKDVVRKEVIKWMDARIVYPISDSKWVSHVQCLPKKGGMNVVTNDKNELIPKRTVTGWRICMDYRKLNEATIKDHYPMPFTDQMLDRLAGHEYYYFLDGYSVVAIAFQVVPPRKRPDAPLIFLFAFTTFFRILVLGLSPGNRELIDRLMSGGRDKYSYETATKFLDLVAKTNKDTEKDQHLIIFLGQMNNLPQKIEELEVMSKEKSQCRLPNEQGRSMDIENKHIEDMLLTNLQKLNEQDRVLEKIRENVDALNQMSSSHSRSIQLIKTLLGHIMPDVR
ncbi:uncharacterized protein LOC125861486 [Solanum stenotomum]|uniref:uncharacterized protein LOC125861486 n=1 Tax=Solanum stenotomum TaxID=172797 RepID=UPI0020D11D8B|nr:uncharacterized protein LOC125861486 [Solanum stenotomum]